MESNRWRADLVEAHEAMAWSRRKHPQRPGNWGLSWRGISRPRRCRAAAGRRRNTRASGAARGASGLPRSATSSKSSAFGSAHSPRQERLAAEEHPGIAAEEGHVISRRAGRGRRGGRSASRRGCAWGGGTVDAWGRAGRTGRIGRTR